MPPSSPSASPHALPTLAAASRASHTPPPAPAARSRPSPSNSERNSLVTWSDGGHAAACNAGQTPGVPRTAPGPRPETRSHVVGQTRAHLPARRPPTAHPRRSLARPSVGRSSPTAGRPEGGRDAWPAQGSAQTCTRDSEATGRPPWACSFGCQRRPGFGAGHVPLAEPDVAADGTPRGLTRTPSPGAEARTLLSPAGTHRSSWAGRMYPAERMLRDRMLGSIRDSSVSGVFRMRPVGKAVTHVTRQGRGGAGSPLAAPAWAGASD